mgnify:FL=1|jgi:hypothetical protein
MNIFGVRLKRNHRIVKVRLNTLFHDFSLINWILIYLSKEI